MKTYFKKEASAEEKLIQEAIEKYGANAYLDTLDSGSSTTVLKGDEIVRVNPDGSTLVIAKLPKNKKEESRLRIRVK
jgi:hypothetical protein